MVFSVSGLVPLLDLVFPVFVSAYILALARFAFPAHGTTSAGSSKEIIFEGNKLFRFYVVVGTTVGLFLLLAYVLGGFARVNMLDFLILVFLPRVFERYFKGRNEIHAKIAEDKYSTAAHKTLPVAAAVANKKTE
ncbi:hypothetical protein LguiB_016347 [Lonicera macranthoides]